tara:strand:+ start:143 stop:382 length:240 start_codon:yes stop_codon:yes gene_type:complete
MNIEVIEVVEQPDGSARLTIDIDSSALAMIVDKFVSEALSEQLKKFEEQKEINLEDAIVQEEMEYADDSLSSIVYGNKD